MLAHHYAEAVRPEDVDLAWAGRERRGSIACARKACDWLGWRPSWRSAATRSTTGIALLQRAAELDPRPDTQAKLWYEIGHANALKYDGQAFTKSMMRALELGAPEGATYAELVYQGAQRGAMWNPPIGEKLDAWVDRALAASAAGSLERGKALVAQAWRKDRPDSAREAIALADALGDDDLRSSALFTLAEACYWAGDLDGMTDAIEQGLEMVPLVTDPDRRANIYVQAAFFAVRGRFSESLRAADLLAETVAGLTPITESTPSACASASGGTWADGRASASSRP